MWIADAPPARLAHADERSAAAHARSHPGRESVEALRRGGRRGRPQLRGGGGHDHGAPRRQRRGQDQHHRHDPRAARGEQRAHHRARRGDTAPPRPGARAHELLLALRRPAGTPERPAEPPRLRRSVPGGSPARAHFGACRGSGSSGDPGPAHRAAVVRAEDAADAGQGADQPARAAPARRADRVARSGHRGRDPRLPRALPAAARRDGAARLAQHGRGRAPVLERADAQARAPGRSGRARGALAPLRPRQPRAGVPRYRPPARRRRRGARRRMRRVVEPAFSPRRIRGMMRRHWYLLAGSWPRVLELAYWPTVQMILWGFITKFLAGHTDLIAQAGGVFLSAVLLWDVLFRGQLSVSLLFMEEMWARHLGHLFVSPLRPYELVVSLFAMSVLRVLIGVGG